MARVGHRSLVPILSVIALAGAALLAAAPPSAAATCEVTNAGTVITYPTLQEAVDGAASGDTLEVRGTCIGKTVIRTTRLRLKGIPTTEQPTPTLDGAQLSRVLKVVSAKVVIRDLAITNGKATNGGGIYALQRRHTPPHPRVTLSGDTSVTGNTARSGGGGIINYGILTLNDSASVTGNKSTAGRGGGIFSGGEGDITLNDSSSVTGNTAEDGGGIFSYGILTLNDSASVTGNTAEGGGGGIYGGIVTMNDSASVTGNSAEYGGGIGNGDYETLTMNDSASVTGNEAGSIGGGIYSAGGVLTLNDSASVTQNTAVNDGGGIYIDPYYPSFAYVCSDQVAISPNDPDDPPKVSRVCP